MKKMEPQLCDLCRTVLTPETKITTFDAQSNMLIVCREKMECKWRADKLENKMRDDAEKPQRDANDRLKKEFGHLPKEEQLKASFNLEMKDFVQEIKSRGGLIYYVMPDGTQYAWEIFDKYWMKCIV